MQKSIKEIPIKDENTMYKDTSTLPDRNKKKKRNSHILISITNHLTNLVCF